MADKKYRSKTGPIPASHFENEPGPPVPLERFMSEESVAEFDAETERLRRELARRRQEKK